MTMYHMGNKFIAFFVLFFTFCISLNAQERKPVPASYGFVNDYASVLKSDEISALETKLKNYYDTTSTQIAVVIESSLNGRNEFDRAMDFARQWEVGTKDKNNGIVIYIAYTDRKIYILNANKTQGALTDGRTGEIIRYVITPQFKLGNYAQGINDGIDSIIKLLQGEFKSTKTVPKGSIVPLIILFLFILLILWLISRNKGKYTGGVSRGGTYWFPTSGGGWFDGGGSSGGGSSWGGFGGGGGFDGGGAGGSW